MKLYVLSVQSKRRCGRIIRPIDRSLGHPPTLFGCRRDSRPSLAQSKSSKWRRVRWLGYVLCRTCIPSSSMQHAAGTWEKKYFVITVIDQFWSGWESKVGDNSLSWPSRLRIKTNICMLKIAPRSKQCPWKKGAPPPTGPRAEVPQATHEQNCLRPQPSRCSRGLPL